MSRTERQAGFTLLEVVVALMVLGLAVAASFDVFSTGFGQSSAAERHVVAVIHAENRLAALGALEPLTPGDSAGEIDDVYRWKQTVTPVRTEPSDQDTPFPFHLVRVDVTVLWGNDADPNSVTLSTERMAAP